MANPIATEVIVGQITAGSGFTGSTNTTNVCPIAANGHCLTLARAFGGLATSCSWPPFFSLQAFR